VNAANVSFATNRARRDRDLPARHQYGRLAILPNGTGAGNWCAAGDFNGWNNNLDHLNDNGTGGDLAGGDGVYSLDLTVATAARLSGRSSNAATGATLTRPPIAGSPPPRPTRCVKITFDTNNHAGDTGIPWIPRPTS